MEQEPFELSPDERRDIEADLDDLTAMRALFEPQSVKGVVIACADCGSNHYYEWDLLRENLQHMLERGEPRVHEPPFKIFEDEYIQWDYGKGYLDAVAEMGMQPGRRIEVTQCPWCELPFSTESAFCARCGRSMATVRLYRELIDKGFEERDVRAMLVRAGYEPF